ncbi:MAG: PAS domain-containing protein [Deltaproteobacteria bacterium]|nr:PAS domain-containing protein [Deltaproteobacteria bacterium]
MQAPEPLRNSSPGGLVSSLMSHPGGLAQRLPRVMLGRVILASTLLGAALIYQWFRIEDGPVLRVLSPTYGTISFIYAATVVWSFLFRRWEERPNRLILLTKSQLVVDVLTIAFLVVVSGGPSSVFSYLFIVVVIYAGFLLSERWAFWAAAMGTAGHAAAVFLVYLYPQPIMRETLGFLFKAPDLAECLFSVFVQSGSLFAAGAVTSYIAERLQQTGDLLERSEVDRRELEQLHERIVSNLTSGIVTTDSRGRVLYLNAAAHQFLQTGHRVLTGAGVREVFPAFAEIAEKNPGGIDRVEVRVIGDTGDRYFGLTVTPLRDETGRSKGNIFIFQDLTQLKRAEERLQKADRLAAIGELAAGIAHEIRNPLTSISGCVQMLSNDLPPDMASSRLFAIVSREIDRLNTLITEFLQFARPKPLEPSQIDVQKWLEDIGLQFRSAASDSARLTVSVAAEAGQISADRDMLTQAVWNLLRNSDQALGTTPGGKIRLSAWKESGPNGPRLQIEIADNGPGIPVEMQARVFEPFYTTKAEGTGLGLSLVYKIVELHGGEVDLSTSPAGTVFSIRIPGSIPAESSGELSTSRAEAV